MSLEGIEHAAQSRPRRKGGESFLHTRNGNANSLPNTRTANMQNCQKDGRTSQEFRNSSKTSRI